MTLVSGIICFLVQCFLVLRVWKRKSTSSRLLCFLCPDLGRNIILSVLGKFTSLTFPFSMRLLADY